MVATLAAENPARSARLGAPPDPNPPQAPDRTLQQRNRPRYGLCGGLLTGAPPGASRPRSASRPQPLLGETKRVKMRIVPSGMLGARHGRTGSALSVRIEHVDAPLAYSVGRAVAQDARTVAGACGVGELKSGAAGA